MNNPLGRYSDFAGDSMDTGANIKPSRGSGNGGFGQPSMGGMGMGGGNMGMIIRQEIQSIKAVVADLQEDKDKLRNGIRKLKVENSRMKARLRRMAEAIKKATGATLEELDDIDDDMEFDEIKNYLLIGGPYDPFGLRFDCTIVDNDGKEHKSAERYFWYKMAEQFGDSATGEAIRNAPTTLAAEEKMKEIKDFDEAIWNGMKMKVWEEAQTLKFQQNRDLQNLLVYSDPNFLAVASQDKIFGTGWRKGREESAKPKMWDGENGGGKALMKLREALKVEHKFVESEEKETEKRFKELRNNTWRRQRNEDNYGGRGGYNRGGRGYNSGGFNRGGGYRGGRGRGGQRQQYGNMNSGNFSIF